MLNAEAFVKDQIPLAEWSKIPTLLKTAYKAATELAKDTPLLQVNSARDNRGRLVSWAVDFFFERAIELGSLSCDCRWATFAEPTGRYLELQYPHSTVSISQVANPNRQPRPVVFRENARLNNGQRLLDFGDSVIEDEEEVTGFPHILLIHGHQDLHFAHWAVPSATSKYKYAWRSNNLIKLAHEVPSDVAPREDTDYDLNDLNLLKEKIDKWRRDNENR